VTPRRRPTFVRKARRPGWIVETDFPELLLVSPGAEARDIIRIRRKGKRPYVLEANVSGLGTSVDLVLRPHKTGLPKSIRKMKRPLAEWAAARHGLEPDVGKIIYKHGEIRIPCIRRQRERPKA
jgi:hypothetical protein